MPDLDSLNSELAKFLRQEPQPGDHVEADSTIGDLGTASIGIALDNEDNQGMIRCESGNGYPVQSYSSMTQGTVDYFCTGDYPHNLFYYYKNDHGIVGPRFIPNLLITGNPKSGYLATATQQAEHK